MMSHDRLASGVVLALALMASSPTPAWPDQPVRIVVPFAAGGTTDVMARVLAERLSPHLGQPVIIENVAGSGGNNGAALVAKSTPNGSTILMATPGPAAMNQFMYSRMPFDTATAFAPIVYIASVPSVLVVSPKVDAQHLGGTLFMTKTGVKKQHVPYRGSAPMLQDLIAGNIQFAIDTVPGLMSFITSGTLKALAVTSKLRSPALPEVLNNVEAGIPDVEMSSWLALLAPAGTPRAAIEQLNTATNTALQESQLRQKIMDLGAVPEGGSPEDLAAFLHSEAQKWKRVIEIASVKID
jgi:tripartite-type tricarboxylate transporter receptor subunit TctC